MSAPAAGAEFPHQDVTPAGQVHAPLPRAASDPEAARIFGEARRALAARLGLLPGPETPDGAR